MIVNVTTLCRNPSRIYVGSGRSEKMVACAAETAPREDQNTAMMAAWRLMDCGFSWWKEPGYMVGTSQESVPHLNARTPRKVRR